MIRILCPSCNARYRIDPSKLAGRSQARAKCPKCGESIDIEAASADAAPPAEGAHPPPTEERERNDVEARVARRDPPPSTARVKSLRSDEAMDSGTVVGMEAASHLTLPTDKKYSLAVLHGKASGRIFELTAARTTIGRSDADVVLDDVECSREHAIIEVLGSEARIRDMGSTNGTFIDGNQIDKATLENHTEFRIGEHVLMFIVTDRE